MYNERFTMLKSELNGMPFYNIDAMQCIADLMKAASLLISTDGYFDIGNELLNIVIDYAELMTEIRDRTTEQSTMQE